MAKEEIIIRGILERNIKYPKCPFEKMKLSAKFDQIVKEIKAAYNDGSASSSK